MLCSVFGSDGYLHMTACSSCQYVTCTLLLLLPPAGVLRWDLNTSTFHKSTNTGCMICRHECYCCAILEPFTRRQSGMSCHIWHKNSRKTDAKRCLYNRIYPVSAQTFHDIRTREALHGHGPMHIALLGQHREVPSLHKGSPNNPATTSLQGRQSHP